MSGMCAGVLLCGMTFICALVLNGLHVESVQTPPENSRSIPVSPVTMEFGEFEGSFGNQYVGKISKDTLKSFGGSVKIMLDIKTVPEFVNAAEVYLIYPVDSDGTNMINGCAAFGDRRTADVSGAVEIDKKARQFSFVLKWFNSQRRHGGLYRPRRCDRSRRRCSRGTFPHLCCCNKGISLADCRRYSRPSQCLH